MRCEHGDVYGECKFQKDDWHIIGREDGSHWFWHVCGGDGGVMPWLVNFYKKNSSHHDKPEEDWYPSWRCCACWDVPPDDILGVYILLEMDACAAEIQTEIQAVL